MICCKTICIYSSGLLFCAYTALLESRKLSQGFSPQRLVALRSPPTAAAAAVNTSNPTGQHETRRQTVEKSRWHLVVSFSPQMLASETLREEQAAKSVVSGATWTPQNFKTFNQATLLKK